MKTYLLSFILLACFVLKANTICGQEQFSMRYNISFVTMDNGLLHNFIDDIYKDKRGFLWISTGGGGLSRYDGYEFVHYNTNTVRTKLKSNFIRNVYEDSFNRLWIASEGGLDILDLATGQHTLPHDVTGQLRTLTDQPIRCVMKDSKDAMWFFSGNTLYRLTFNDRGDVIEWHSLPSIPLTVQAITIKDMDEDGNIWAGIGNSVCKLFPEADGQIRKVNVDSCLVFEPGIFISSFLLKENEAWIGTDRGLIRYNRNEKIAKRYIYDWHNNRSITQNHITDLATTADKQLLISTLRGINIYNPITDDFEQIMQESNSSNAHMNSDFINCMLVDGEMIWFGTETGGINKMIPRKLSVRNYRHIQDDPYSLSRNIVNAIYEDTKGNLWVGTVEGGLNRKPAGKERFFHYKTEPPARLSHNSVSAITGDESNCLWVGTWGNGINVLDLSRPDYPVIKYVTSQTHAGFPIDFIGSLCYDAFNKGIWIGTNSGIFFYDLAADKIFSPFADGNSENIRGSIGAIIDSQDKLWMGCMEGIYIIDLHSRNGNHFLYRHLKYKLDAPDSRLTEKASCFCIASDNTLWIGSNGYGIYKYIPGTEEKATFISYTTEQGLINNNIRGIAEGKEGCLWISTNNGLSCFDPQSNRFTNYTKEDGLAGNQFYWNAYCTTRDKRVYFGGLNGLTAVENILHPTKKTFSKVSLTKLRVVNEEIHPTGKYIEEDISTAGILHLHERDKSFSLEFSALNYEQQPTASYSYRLQGFDEQWMEVPATRRFASYTNLPPGRYTFQVKYASEEEENNDSPITELAVIVSPFFYKTPWFILLMTALMLCSVFYFYKRRIYSLKRQRELLHRTVQERTKELEEQKLVLENQTAELSRQNDMLTRQNEKITRQKAQLVRMSKKVQELTIDKLSFFTNITHEFRTPITLIIGPIERALKLSYNPQVIEQLHFVERNSKYLLSLVNQLMDFRKVESGKLEIVKNEGNFLQFVQSLIVPFEVFAGERNITIHTYFRLSSPYILYDQEAMQKVITNLLSNAIKFTPDGGKVNIYAASIMDINTGKEKLYISVKDTGTGIAEEDITRIFNRFYQSRNHMKYPVYGQSGTGIGLYLCKRIVQLHGGTIKAQNNRNAGSTFRILLPLQRETTKDRQVTVNEDVSSTGKELSYMSQAFTPGRLTILVVEDNKDMRDYIRSILSEHYNILEAENGAEALTILNECNTDFIISDLMMPVMDGIELSRRVKENFLISHIPFLMLTAKTSTESRLESYRTGVDEYLLKPFNEELLLTRITNILENRKRQQQRFISNMEVESLQIEEESSDKKFLNKAIEIIKENYQNSYYEASDFIEAMGVSKSLLNKKLQNLTGQSIGQFIRNYRLNIARELINKNKITRNMNISEIAYEVGFNDPKYFTRCFTKRFNVPPSSLMEGE